MHDNKTLAGDGGRDCFEVESELRKVRIDDCGPPDPSRTVLGLRDQEIPDGLVEFVRRIAPEKPLMLDSETVEVPVEPTLT